jgi:hypothetical protein
VAEAGGAPQPSGTGDAFADAERLVREAQRAAEDAVRAAGGEVPPRGWAAASGDTAGPGPAAFPDLSGLAALLEAVRHTVPPELGRQLADALRDLLVALRAVLDFSITRLERPAPAPVEVEDIPVE